MRKNVLPAVVTGVVVAAAVLGTGWLLTRGAPREAPGFKPQPPGGDVTRAPAAPVAELPEPRAPKPGARGPKLEARPPGSGAEQADVCGQVDELLREYERIVSPGGAAVPGEPPAMLGAQAIETLRERAQRIEQLVVRLAELGPDAVPCLVDHFRADARTQRIDRQNLAVRALAKIPGPAAFAALAEALTTSDAWGVKMTVIAQLAESGGEEGLALLASRVDAERDFRVRAAILKFLGQRKSPAGLLAAQRIAMQDENPNVRISALRALGEAGDESARQVLEDRARADPDIAVRQNAIQVYGRVFREAGLGLLEDLLATDTNLRIKAVVILALQEMGGDAARRALERLANDPSANEEVRARATGALAALDRSPAGGGLPAPIENVPLERPLAPVPAPAAGAGARR